VYLRRSDTSIRYLKILARPDARLVLELELMLLLELLFDLFELLLYSSARRRAASIFEAPIATSRTTASPIPTGVRYFSHRS
jgi:hypothetical protein